MSDELIFADEVLNELIARALAPIPGEAVCGTSDDVASSMISQIETTSDSIFSMIHSSAGEAMRSDGGSQCIDLASVGRGANELVEQTITCLETKCKSLILAAYLPNLMLISYGLPGFSAGLHVVGRLVEQYPDELFPPDRERILNYLKRGVYIGNDDQVTDNYRLFLYTPITENQSSQRPYALLRNSRLKNPNAEIDAKYNTDASKTDPQFYVRMIADLHQIVALSKSTNVILGSYLNDSLAEIVGFSFIESLERMAAIVTRLATDHCPGYPPVDASLSQEVAIVGGPAAVAGAAPAATLGEITSREQAIELLIRIADFFRRTERHSPVSYSLRQAVKWTKMDLPELLEELFSGDQQPLDELAKRVGFRKPGSDEEEDND